METLPCQDAWGAALGRTFSRESALRYGGILRILSLTFRGTKQKQTELNPPLARCRRGGGWPQRPYRLHLGKSNGILPTSPSPFQRQKLASLGFPRLAWPISRKDLHDATVRKTCNLSRCPLHLGMRATSNATYRLGWLRVALVPLHVEFLPCVATFAVVDGPL